MNPILRHETHTNSSLSPTTHSKRGSFQPNNIDSIKYRQLFPNRPSYGTLIPPVGSIARAQLGNLVSSTDIPDQNEASTLQTPSQQNTQKRSNLSALLNQQYSRSERNMNTTKNESASLHVTKEETRNSLSQTNHRRCLSSKELGELATPSGSPYAFMLYQKERIEVEMRERLKLTRTPPRTVPPSDDSSRSSRGRQMTNQARNQRRREHNIAITNDLCEIVTDLFIAESKLLNPSNYGVDSAIKREQVLRSVERFVGSLPPRYALGAETPSEVLLHMRLLAAVRSDPTRAVVHITNLEGESHWTNTSVLGKSTKQVTIACTDTIGLLEYVTKMLATGGSRVLDADVMLSSDNVILDRFVVEMNGRLRLDKLSQCIEKFLEQTKKKKRNLGLLGDSAIAENPSVRSDTSINHSDIAGNVYYRASPSMNDVSRSREIDEELKAAVPLSEMIASGNAGGKLQSGNDFPPQLRRHLSLPPTLQPRPQIYSADQVPAVDSVIAPKSAREHRDDNQGQQQDSLSTSDSQSTRQRRPLVNRAGTPDFDAVNLDDNVESSAVSSKRRPLVNREAHSDLVDDAFNKYDLALESANRNIPLIPFDELMLIETLGMGRVSTIYRAAWRKSTPTQFTDAVSSHMLALKVAMSTATNHSSSVDELRREADIASRLQHPNICDLLGVAFDSECFCLAYAFCEGGSLFSLLSDSTRYYEYLPIALDIANGMAYLHSRNVIHRDLKPSNVLLTRDHRAKIADFGMSVANTGQELTAETGTYRYMAPEVIRHESYSSNADVYSFGVCLWQLITREVPFATMTPIQAAYAVAEGHRPTIPESTPRRLKEIISACWDQDTGRRPSFTYIAMALADYAKLAFSPANVGAHTLQIANEMLATVHGNSTVNVDFTAPVVLGAYMDHPDCSTGGSDIGLEI